MREPVLTMRNCTKPSILSHHRPHSQVFLGKPLHTFVKALFHRFTFEVWLCVCLFCWSEFGFGALRETCKIMDPTEKGVWWKNDQQWERFSPANAQKIRQAFRNGEAKLRLGPFKSPKHPAGVMYTVDLVSMKQTNEKTGFSRDIKIIPGPQDDQEDGSDEDFCGEISPGGQIASSSKEEVEKGKEVVTMIPSVIIDLQKLSTQCRVEDQCNLVLKLPKAVARSDAWRNSLMNKTMSLMVEKLSSKDFIKTVLRRKLPGASWRAHQCHPYRLGRAHQSTRYSEFLNCLCALAEEEEDFLERLFGVAEEGDSVQGDPVEYLFLCAPNPNLILQSGTVPAGSVLLSRALPVKKGLMESGVVVCVGISKFLQEKQLLLRGSKVVVTTRAGTVVPLALLANDSST